MTPLYDIAVKLQAGQVTSRSLVEEALARIADPSGEGPRTFVRVFAEAARASADASDRLRSSGIVPSPLAGVPISIKDLTDVAGVTTLAGSVVRENEPPATRDATVLARLRAAGAVVVGTTNMTEFAFGGLGLNPHYGNCRNPWDRETGRIPGGSSSGAAISVTDGMCAAALGSDTAGSVRMPAGLCGLAGFKPTAARVPVDGLFPLSTTLDSAGPLAPTVACCALMDAIFAAEPPPVLEAEPLQGARLGVPTTLVLDDLDPEVARAFDAALNRLSAAGARIEQFAWPELLEIAEITRKRHFSTVEAYAIHRERLRLHRDRFDPRVAARLLAAPEISGSDYYDLIRFRENMIPRAAATTSRYDAVVMPTLSIVAPPIANFVGSEERLRNPFPITLRNTIIANLLDRCALTVPCHEPGTAPVGFMLMGERMADARILRFGLAVEACFAAELNPTFSKA